ncbi:MAG: hypothetical protein KC613_27460 [Myxococcales bacterium]|nr:hypothetical protein [Myxococcales bacterium]MCB9522568.1 hypothetical protein [Myxococcales bacterium]
MNRSKVTVLTGAVALLGAAVLLVTHPWSPALPEGVPAFRAPALDEVSGMVGSRRHPGVFWVHNDSGDGPRIFAVDATGHLLGEWRVRGADAEDWEDIALDDAGHLWIGDMGNNRNRRRDLTLYRVPEPEPTAGGGEVEVDGTVRFHYAEQREFPPERPDFDAEALFWAPHPHTGQGTLYLLTKHRSGDLATDLYRFDDLSGADVVAPVRVGSVTVGGDPEHFGGMVTAADASADGTRLAVLTYHALFLFERPGPLDDGYLLKLHARVELDQRQFQQCEAVAWDGPDLLIANEQRRIWRVPRAWEAPPERLP